MGAIKERLTADESRYQRDAGATTFASLWSHSARVAHFAHHLAIKEGLDPTAAILAALIHDAGKFFGGNYHQDEEPEEKKAVIVAQEILRGSPYESQLPIINDAILSLYRDDRNPSGIGAILYDADRLDKLGYIGIAQFFSKHSLRGKFLDNDLMKKVCIELTYAHHAPLTLKTTTARKLASRRSERVRSFFMGLLEEWREMELGDFSIHDADVEGIKLVLVVPDYCHCGAGLKISTDVKEGIKCRAAIVEYRCPGCHEVSEFSFCLPVLSNFP